MWSSYHFKIQDTWVPPLAWAPRWFAANGYSDVYTIENFPDTRTSTITGAFTSPSGTDVPYSWITLLTTPSTGSNLQRFFESFVNEKEYLFPLLTTTYLSRQFYFDVADPEYAWLFSSEEVVDSLYIQTTSGLVEIPRALSESELFFSGFWRWKQDGKYVLVYGLDIQPLLDTRDENDWHFVDARNRTSSGGLIYIEHPITKNWYPLHPLKIAEDGNIGIQYSGSIRFRGHSSRAAKLLDEVIVYVNSVERVAKRISLTNSLDEKGLLIGVSRRDSEDNWGYQNAILRSAWFRGQSYNKVRSYLSSTLRSGELITVAASSTSFSLPATATGYSVRNISPFIYVSEFLSPLGTTFYSKYASATYGCGFLRQMETPFTIQTSSVINFSSYINPEIDRPEIRWKLSLLNTLGSSIQLSENFPHEVPDLIVFFPSKVDVILGSIPTRKKSFQRTSPNLKWSNYNFNESIPTGLAEFDF